MVRFSRKIVQSAVPVELSAIEHPPPTAPRLALAAAAFLAAIAGCANAQPRTPSPNASRVSAPPATATAAASAVPSAHAATVSGDLDHEAIELERAMDALKEGDPGRALSICDDEASRFPNGILAQERELVAIRALVRLGRFDEGRSREAKFKSNFADSSYLSELPKIRDTR